MNKNEDLYMSLIEEERRAFIKAEQGRLQALIGMEYWDPADGGTHLFHGPHGAEGDDTPAPDPYELSLGELAALPRFEKHVERIGTHSSLPLFQMFPRDIERIALLASLEGKLITGGPWSAADTEALVNAHESYVKWKLDDTVKVIM